MALEVAQIVDDAKLSREYIEVSSLSALRPALSRCGANRPYVLVPLAICFFALALALALALAAHDYPLPTRATSSPSPRGAGVYQAPAHPEAERLREYS